MSDDKVKEMKEILDTIYPESIPPSEPPIKVCNFNQNGTRQLRFSAGMLFLALFMLELSSNIPEANKWLFFLMAGIFLIPGIVSLNTSIKEVKLSDTGNAS